MLSGLVSKKFIMSQIMNGKNEEKLRILVAPLDWGLGHATRCIPIIRELIKQNCEVWVAGEGGQEALLRKEFPELNFLSLPGYRIHYAKTRTGLVKSIFFQAPKILRAIKNENKWLKEKVNEFGFHAVISDNRYGLYHEKIPCIFITHQLKIKSPLGKWSEKILQKRNYKYINRFSECWIPDEEGENNLAGELSHPKEKPKIPVKYLGILSRMNPHPLKECYGHLLIILSGPEPQRSFFENNIVKQISHYNGSAIVVRGLPVSLSLIPSTNTIHFYNHLPADELENEMGKAEFIICRSGYSSIMDIVKLHKKSILIPTPGQTEQGYLAKYLTEKKIVFSTEQKDFLLEDALTKAKNFNYSKFPLMGWGNENKLTSAIGYFLHSLK